MTNRRGLLIGGGLAALFGLARIRPASAQSAGVPFVSSGTHPNFARILNIFSRRTDISPLQPHVVTVIDTNHRDPELRNPLMDPLVLAMAKDRNFGFIGLEGGAEMNPALRDLAKSAGTAKDVDAFINAFRRARHKNIEEAGLNDVADAEFKKLPAPVVLILRKVAGTVIAAQKIGVIVEFIDQQPAVERVKLGYALHVAEKNGDAAALADAMNRMDERLIKYDFQNASYTKQRMEDLKTNAIIYYGGLHLSTAPTQGPVGRADIDDSLRQMGVAVTMVANINGQSPMEAAEAEIKAAEAAKPLLSFGPATTLHAFYRVDRDDFAFLSQDGFPLMNQRYLPPRTDKGIGAIFKP